MQIQIIDNVGRTTASLLFPAICNADDIRIAVAFVSSDGLSQIMPSLQTALERRAYVEFLVGMDARATDPDAIKDLYALSRDANRFSLLCFVSQNISSIYHPKMYLARRYNNATAIIGSSNLTRRGLKTNIEANIAITDDIHTEIMSEIYSTYNRLKYHPSRVIPDDEFVNLFTDMCHEEKSHERRFTRNRALQDLRKAFIRKSNSLQRPKPTKTDLIGWLELVYDVLPDGEFKNQDIYAYEEEFRQQYPQNLNIRAKIRQQLQILHSLGFIEHPSRGIWKKIG